MMERNKYIEELVERFLDGTTTNEEERELYAFFAGDDVPEHLQSYKAMFAWYDGARTEEFSLREEPVLLVRRPKHRFRIWGTAAVVAATLVLFFLVRPEGTTPDEPQVYVESYIIRDGVKITDPAIVQPELEAVQAQWEEAERRQRELALQMVIWP